MYGTPSAEAQRNKGCVPTTARKVSSMMVHLAEMDEGSGLGGSTYLRSLGSTIVGLLA